MNNKVEKDGQPHVTFRLKNSDRDKLDELLSSLGCTWGNKPSIGVFVKKILKGEITINVHS